MNKLVLKYEPLLIQFVNFPQIFSRQDITIGFTTIVVNVHDFNFLSVKHLQNQSDLLLYLSFVTAQKSSFGINPFGLSITILLFKEFDCLFNRLIVRFSIVSHLIVISFWNIHYDDISVLLFLIKSLVILRLENISAFLQDIFVEAGFVFLLGSIAAHKSILFELLAIFNVINFLLFVFFLLGVLFLFDFCFLFEPVESASLTFLLFEDVEIIFVDLWLFLPHSFESFLFFFSLSLWLFAFSLWIWVHAPRSHILIRNILIIISNEISHFVLVLLDLPFRLRVWVVLWVALLDYFLFLLLWHLKKFIIFLYTN